MPGACVIFQITAMKANASISNFTVKHKYYKPSKPNVTILMQSKNVVLFNITQDGGFANRYEINGTIFEHGVKWNCTLKVDTSQFALNSTVLANDCNVTFVPGMCFSLQVMTVSENAISDAFSANNICYRK
ncbi:hypothetical protein CHS0354_009154 [Potamilus streckersoni]|uniref:Uncharacterized protein n=1 Tax=Potamilus streckersoni TaxID=2493646 RepID=A0AAE0W1N8_9BIVA|nr:hypothetical protein CHS0354_009154 [Potamilus streckersoni]